MKSLTKKRNNMATPALQLKPNQWSCSVTAFAMALRFPVQQLIEELGHDGSEIIFPDLPEPMCRRGFHAQELILAAWRHDFACTPLELFPQTRSNCGQHTYRVGMEDHLCWGRFKECIVTTFGILEGHGKSCHHAVHYRYGYIWDPDGDQYFYSRQACEDRGFFGNRLWIFSRHNA